MAQWIGDVPGSQRMFRVPGTAQTQTLKGLFRVFRVFRVPARTCTRIFFSPPSEPIFSSRTRVYPEHPEHPEQTRASKALRRSGYPEHAPSTRNIPSPKPMKTPSLRQTMPRTAEFVDACREFFGTAEVNAAIRAGIDGQPTFFASENGYRVGTPAPPDRGLTLDRLVIGPLRRVAPAAEAGQ